MEMIKNAINRYVPALVNGKATIPYKGIGKHIPTGRKAAPPIATCAHYPSDGNKLVSSIREALEKCELRSGMVISTHHHFRDGDLVANIVFKEAEKMGVKDLVWFPSASFPCHAPIIELLENGVIHHIEGSLNGPLGDFASRGKMKGTAVLRSHGGRYRAIQDDDIHIDITIIAAPTSDPFGNSNGVEGPSACGLLGFALADSQYADRVIVVTANLVPFPCIPWQIQGNYVDYVVQIDRIGIPEKIVSGTTQITKSPDRLLIAEMTTQFMVESGIVHEGFSIQAGAGGVSLAVIGQLKEYMKEKNIHSRFMRGGSTQYLVNLLEEGYTDYILDGQTFDLDGVRSMRENPRHVWTSPFTSYNYHGKGNFAGMIDATILGATEIDLNYNANVVTHSDGRLLHGIGGWQNCLFGKCVILTVPSFRDRIPIILDEVTTVCGPGDLIDVIVTERGIAINPRREDLLDSLKNTHLPIRTIEDLKAEVEDICGGVPDKPELSDNIIAVVEWVDGTLIDSIKAIND
ncbi:MAG: citrate lyase subunit alpha [Candidatus Coatesbacteria bacterium]|nr:citrate lyase subunit alpha [Candidatus Coatesbacteria bacterium]